MEEKQKKLLICLLLLISCVASALLLIYAPAAPSQQLSGFEQADSLVLAGFDEFNISEKQVSLRSVAMDSLHNRNIYRIAVPPGFSKTQFHLELSQTLSPFNVSTPANVIFPQEDMIIHMVYHQTVIRTIVLQTDPDLVMEHQYKSSFVPSRDVSISGSQVKNSKLRILGFIDSCHVQPTSPLDFLYSQKAKRNEHSVAIVRGNEKSLNWTYNGTASYRKPTRLLLTGKAYLQPMTGQNDTNRWLDKFKLREFPEPECIVLKHPVLLCHGYGAITLLTKPSPLYDVAMLMRSHAVLAYAPNIVPYARIETRAESWVRLIHRLQDELECSKLNIIAHSMGGLDMRYAISRLDVAPAVESLTTISTPHYGNSLAELVLNAPETIREKIGSFLDWMGDHVYPDTKNNSVASAEQLTREYITSQFNPSVPDVEVVSYYSYSSAVGKGTNEPIQILVRYQNNHVYEAEGLNDGMISVQSSKWGTHIRTGNISHFEQLNFNTKEERKPLFKTFWLDVLKMLQSNGH